MRRRRLLAMALLATGAVAPASLAGTGVVDEYGTRGAIPGVTFTGGDGSYKRVVRDGIVLGISADFPWSYQDERTKEYKGIDVEVFREVARRLGIARVSYNTMPFDSLIPALLARRIDVIADNIHENPKRLAVIDFTAPAYFYGPGIATQRGNPKKISSWDSLRGRRLGVVRGTQAQAMAEEIRGVKELKLYSSADTEYADLVYGRLDAVLDDATRIAMFVKRHPGINMELSSVVVPPSLQGYARYGIRKDDVDLNNAVSRAIEEMRADGTIMNIIARGGLPARNLFNFSIPR